MAGDLVAGDLVAEVRWEWALGLEKSLASRPVDDAQREEAVVAKNNRQEAVVVRRGAVGVQA